MQHDDNSGNDNDAMEYNRMIKNQFIIVCCFCWHDKNVMRAHSRQKGNMQLTLPLATLTLCSANNKFIAIVQVHIVDTVRHVLYWCHKWEQKKVEKENNVCAVQNV